MPSLLVHAQKKTDKENIKLLCGCFDVEFKYAETFAPDRSYKYHDREKITSATELVIPIEETKNKIVLQHLLVIDDSMIVKHWREDWTYENPVMLKYNGNHIWERENLVPSAYKKKWMQTVWEVSDAPRYQGTGEWVHADNKIFWMSTTDAPLPRREYTKRHDYNILRRRNMIEVRGDGWVHEQDNEKIIRAQGTDSLLAEEKGWNTYRRIDDSRCTAAKIYWKKNSGYWKHVRAAWEQYLGSHDSVTLRTLVDGKPLHAFLSDIEQQFAEGRLSANELNVQIDNTLHKFIVEGALKLARD
jgi:hypothetical protein